FLGSGYTVLASMGHVRDLPKSKMGVDVDSGFAPEYEVIKGKEKQIRELRAAARKAQVTLLAADPDREGEAIAWHLAQALGLRDSSADGMRHSLRAAMARLTASLPARVAPPQSATHWAAARTRTPSCAPSASTPRAR